MNSAGVGRRRASLLGLAVGAAATVSPGSAVAVSLWMLPGILTWIGERRPGRPVAWCVLLAGAAGALPGLAALWRDPAGFDQAAAVALDPAALAVPWAAQAAAWLLTETLPLMALALAERAADRRMRALLIARRRLEEDYAAEA